MPYTIITDSACDLPQSVVQAFNLTVIPTPVVIDGVDYLDSQTISANEFYQLQAEKTHSISTYHINPQMFEEAFRPFAENKKQVLYICFSTGIAATYNAANIAKQNILAEYPDFQIDIFDSKKVSIGMGLMVCRLLQLQKAGASYSLILQAAEFYRQHIRTVFTVQTLHYLIQGGRIGKASGLVGEALGMKPIIIVNQAGALEKEKVIRGTAASIKTLEEHVIQHTAPLPTQMLAVCYGGNMENLKVLTSLLQAHGANQFLTQQVGCAIGAHTGPDVLGVCYLDTPENAYQQYLPQNCNFI